MNIYVYLYLFKTISSDSVMLPVDHLISSISPYYYTAMMDHISLITLIVIFALIILIISIFCYINYLWCCDYFFPRDSILNNTWEIQLNQLNSGCSNNLHCSLSSPIISISCSYSMKMSSNNATSSTSLTHFTNHISS
jgi:hypothetical protein